MCGYSFFFNAYTTFEMESCFLAGLLIRWKSKQITTVSLKSLCQYTYTFTISSSFRMRSGSLAIGEKWQMQLLTDMQVGNAIPFFKSFSFLKTLLVSSSSSLSPYSQASLTDAPATHLSRTCFKTSENNKTFKFNNIFSR